MIQSGGITSAKGFKAWGEHVGLKRFSKDLALVVSETPAHVAAVFTTNAVKAAPVLWNQKVLASGAAVKAILVNSGQANSCTGAQGILNASLMAAKTAEELGCDVGSIMLASTGVIGAQIDIDNALKGISAIAGLPREDEFAGTMASEAILTTDTCVKQCAAKFVVHGVEVTIGAMGKGSGMIHPNMATMLGFIATDAAIAPDLLQKALKENVASTYNMISVDGDTSTNDMVIMLANGQAGNIEISEENEHYAAFCAALNKVNTFLSKKIACDVAGTTKKIAVTVNGAATLDDARTIAKKAVSSNLVKASIFKAEANWGRVIAACGSAGINIDAHAMNITYASEHGAIVAFEDGEQHANFDYEHAKHILSALECEIHINFKSGTASATAWGCDMEYDPIRTSRRRTGTESGGTVKTQEFAGVG